MEQITVSLSELGEIVGGATPSTINEEYYNGDIPWITPRDLSGYSDRYIAHGERLISQEGFNSCSTKMLPAGSVLFTSRAPIGYVAIAKNDLCTNQGFKSIIPFDMTESLFIYYLLVFFKDTIEATASGTTFKEVSGSVMRQIKVSIPESHNSRIAIGTALSSLDDKIELNNRIIANLEAQSQAIFKSWFVDFEPFQDCEFEESELGLIPKGWRVGTFSEIIEKLIPGDWGKDSPEGNNTQEVFCIRGADIPEVRNGNKGEMPIRYILPKNFVSKQLEENDLVTEISGGSPTQSTGRIALITKSLLGRYDKPMICTNFCKAVKPIAGFAAFIYYYWQYLYDLNVLFSYENGTTGIKNLNINGFVEVESIVIPDDPTASKFNDIVMEFQETVFSLGKQNEQLALIRNALLPKLMSGEIEVPVEG